MVSPDVREQGDKYVEETAETVQLGPIGTNTNAPAAPPTHTPLAVYFNH